MEKIKVITSSGVVEQCADHMCAEVAGQKAMGLLGVPLLWRLPFLVIHKNIYETYRNGNAEEKQKLLSGVAMRIEESLKDWKLLLGSRIILRSSGIDEGMSERGKYESIACQVEDIYETLEILYRQFLEKEEDGIAYIVQPFVERRLYGHISNERRISRVGRDWKIEYENTEDSVESLGVRKWRRSYRNEELENKSLLCAERKDLKDVLRKVAYYYCSDDKKSLRFHMEFVWDGNEVYIVQKDTETLNSQGEIPTNFPIQVGYKESIEQFEVLRKISEQDGKRYKKVQNALLYKELGLMDAPLYILDNRELIELLRQGHINEALEKDLYKLTKQSLVIRTDVDLAENPDAQLLPRSNELRSFNEAMKWFQDRLSVVLQYQQVAIIFHIFIPSISAAFAYATPKSRMVTIHSLWGLPEGLYYNAHDTFLLDTGTKDINHVDEDKVIVRQKSVDYKAVYIAPDEDGKWREKRVKIPYDWQTSITSQQAKRIAKGSLMIAQKVGMPLSIMWFVGIDENFYHTDCIPWFHEQYSENTFSHETYKKKYFSEKEVVISSEKDLEKYENDSSIKAITIHPKDDETLRNGTFIDSVGKFAKRKNIAIFLEGTILAHPVYRLMAQNVRVILAKKNKEQIDKMQFDKLVRDRIPQKIIENMESIQCYQTSGKWLIRYLKEKLVEEAYEFWDAQGDEERCKELADIHEVLGAIKNQCGYLLGEKMNLLRSRQIAFDWNQKMELLVASSKMNLWDVEMEDEIALPFMNVLYSVERTHQNIEFEVKLSKRIVPRGQDGQGEVKSEAREGRQKFKKKSKKSEEQRYSIVKRAYAILDEQCFDSIITLCNDLEEELLVEVANMGISNAEFVGICADKNAKNGGFDKGFVLRNTAVHTEGENRGDSDQYELDLGQDDESFYPELKELLFTPVTYSDYRYVEEDELIIRIKYPLCFDTWMNEIVSLAVKTMFDPNSRLLVKADRVGTFYTFNIYLCSETYEQMSFGDI